MFFPLQMSASNERRSFTRARESAHLQERERALVSLKMTSGSGSSSVNISEERERERNKFSLISALMLCKEEG